MAYDSPLKMFRNMYKDPDVYRDPQEKADIEKMKAEEGSGWKEGASESEKPESKEKRPELPESSPVRKFEEAVKAVKACGLKPEFANDSVEAALLKERQRITLSYFSQVLEDIRNYLTQVNYGNAGLKGYGDNEEEQADFRASLGLSDAERRRLHNKMISDIKIAIRLANNNFNADFPEEKRLEEEKKLPGRQGLSDKELREKLAERQYVKFPFPHGAFLDYSVLPKDPQSEREYIAGWALSMYDRLTQLEEDIKGSR